MPDFSIFFVGFMEDNDLDVVIIKVIKNKVYKYEGNKCKIIFGSIQNIPRILSNFYFFKENTMFEVTP